MREALALANFLVWEPFVLAGVMGFLVNLQQDKCYFLFCNFSSLYEWKSVTPLKVRALKKGSPVYFRLPGTFLTHSKSNRIHRLMKWI